MAPGVHTMARKYFNRSNMIGRDEVEQLQMDQSSAVYCLKFGFCLECSSGMFLDATFSSV